MRGKQINKHIQMEQRRYFAHTIKTHLEINIIQEGGWQCTSYSEYVFSERVWQYS